MKVAVIGAGPAGLTAAYQLTCQNRSKMQIDIYEASECPGGMARSMTLWGQRVDLGPHRFFSNDPRVNHLWRQIIGDDFDIVSRLTSILYQSRLYYYPLKPGNVFKNFGFSKVAGCLQSYLKGLVFPQSLDGSFEQWMTRNFGRALYEFFFKDYSEKLWGIPCSELEDDFAKQRIKKLDLFEAIRLSVLGGKNPHRSWVDEFYYPHGGTGTLYERMAKSVLASGGNIHYKTPISRLVAEGNRVRGFELSGGKKTLDYDAVISTMPLTLLVGRMHDVPPEVQTAAVNLSFRNSILVYLHLKGHAIFPEQWVYVQSTEIRTGRVTNFRNWSPSLCKNSENTVIAMEYWCSDGDPLWESADEELIRMAVQEIKIITSQMLQYCGEKASSSKSYPHVVQPSGRRAVHATDVLEGHVVRVPKCYPVYKRGYRDNLDVIRGYLKRFENLQVIGRYGSFKYNNQDHSILMGILAAENISNGARHDLWDVNASEEYQES